MLSNTHRINEADMLLDWGRAEADSYIRRSECPLPPDIEARAVSGVELSEPERLLVIARITVVRSWMLGGLISVGLDWYTADLPAAELANVRVIDITDFSGWKTIGELAEHRPNIYKPSFDQTKMRGHPIVVAPSQTGPVLLIEGTTRSCELLRLHKLGKLRGDAIRVIAGVGAPVPMWWRWR